MYISLQISTYEQVLEDSLPASQIVLQMQEHTDPEAQQQTTHWSTKYLNKISPSAFIIAGPEDSVFIPSEKTDIFLKEQNRR